MLGVIYESRPNVTVDASCLSIKSGNSIILRGGSDSFYTSKELVKNIIDAFKEVGLPSNCVQMIDTPEREAVDYLLQMREYVDVIIPRGGKGLIEKINASSKIPVIKHLDGICHVYVDEEADINIAERVVFNSKMRRPEICGAAETLLIDEKIKDMEMGEVIKDFYKSDAPQFKGKSKKNQRKLRKPNKHNMLRPMNILSNQNKSVTVE